MARLLDITQQQRPVARVPGRTPPLALPDVESIGPGLRSLGEGIVGGSEEIYRAQKIEEERVNTLRAEEAYNTFLERKIDLTVGEENGFSNLTGTEAVGRQVFQEWGKRLDDAERTIATELSNDEQRQKFRSRAQIAQLQYKEDLLRFLAKKADAHAQAVHESTLAIEMQNAVSGRQSENLVNASLERIKNSVMEQADRYNWPAEMRESALFAEESKIHEAVIYSLLADNPSEARGRFEKNKKRIDGTKYSQIERALREGGTREASQAKADAILGAIDSETSPKDFREQSRIARDAAKAITDPEVRDATRIRVAAGLSVLAAERAQIEEERGNDAWGTVLEGGGLDDITPVQLANLRFTQPGTVVGLERYIALRDKGEDAVTNWGRYYELEQLAADKPAEFTAIDLRKDLYQLAPQQFATLSSLQRGTKGAMGSAEQQDRAEQQKRISYSTARTVAKDLLEGAGISTSPTDGEDQERLAKFYDRLFLELEDLQTLQQGKATEAQVRETATTLLQTHKQAWVGTDVLLFEAPVEELYKRIPATERAKLEQAMSARGESIARENVIRRWQRLQRLERARAARAVRTIPP